MADSLLESTSLIGKALVEEGLVSCGQLEQLLSIQPTQKQRLGETAVSMGFISDADLAKFLSKFFHVPYTELSPEEIETSAVELLPEPVARRYAVMIMRKEGGYVSLAMADPLDIRAVDAVRHETKCRVRKMVTGRSTVLKAIDRCYRTSTLLTKSMDSIFAGEMEGDKAVSLPSLDGDNLATDQLKLEATDGPVIQLVNLLLMCAVQERASDIHIEPEENALTVRFRVDGQLREMSSPPKQMCQGIITRIKLLGNLDIAEHRLPQDGRFKFNTFDKDIDVRVSCLPTIYGEKIVMRILDRGSLILDMKALGFEPQMLETLRRVLKLPHGLVILTGPTGSGKTTTLYAALNSVKSPSKNIVTIEDPVEYQLSKINQVNTKADIGLTFAAGLRSILRQDPDIIMVGEIRDRETAEISMRSALTGHMVLSTLHTNDAVSVISRLTDMGIEPYLLAATLNLVMAQRLVRRICEDCAQGWQPPHELMERLSRQAGIESGAWNFRRGAGCERCGHSGYRGRIAVYEQFVVSDKIKRLIAEAAPLNDIKEAARKEGLQSLLSSALKKAQEGTTTLDEAFSVCGTQSETLET